MQKKRLRESTFLKLLAKSGGQEMPTSSTDKELEEKKEKEGEQSTYNDITNDE